MSRARPVWCSLVPGLGGLCPVSGADDGVQARLPAVGEHVIQIIIDPFVHLESIG